MPKVKDIAPISHRQVQNFLARINTKGPFPHAKACEVHPDIKGKRCWEWLGMRTGAGYGSCVVLGQWLAHRASWVLYYWRVPKHHVMHKCDNRRCVRPSHLMEGTAQDNTNDKKAKNRQWRPKGELSACGKLTECKVRKIRKMYATGLYTLTDLAQKIM